MSKNQICHILIVDDELINLEILKEVLNDEYDIMCASSGKEALELTKKYLPDLVLLDVMMPDMDGFEVCRRLKANNSTATIPIIFVTCLNDTRAEVAGLQAGAIDYVTKPINPLIVRMRVHNHIKLQRVRNHLKSLASIDALTDLANRRQFDEVLQNELNRQSRLHYPLSLIMLDVDFFKKFNDGYGHVEGDNCLKQVAYTIRGCLHRLADFAARYGGEEFSCILPNTNQAGAIAIAEKIRKSVENLNIPHRNSHVSDYVTVSIGVFTMPAYSKITPSKIVELADQQLYRAKEQGRNRICSSQRLDNGR